jgi:hypothetical protein
MPRRKDVHFRPWAVYYVGRALELAGLVLTTWSMFLFFGTSSMRPMLAMTGAGGALFFVGWLLARKNPEEKRS